MNLFVSFVRLVRDNCIVIDLELFWLYVILNIPLWPFGTSYLLAFVTVHHSSLSI